MLFGLLILGTALMLSSIAAFYSIVGLVAIFSAMPIPIIIMGGSLEIAKIVTTVFLHNNWKRLSILYKMYLVPAVVTLMLLTSLGIFGLLSKAHSDQSLVSGDSLARVSVYDEKIKTAKDNIDTSRRALKQMDEAVDQVMGRSQDEKGADKAVAIRRGQARERVRLQAEIAAEQKTISQLSEERAPLAAEFRKVENEVGPVKYIAALVYGDNPDSNLLEKAVRLVIMMIVLVFDPLALTLILAANRQFEWAREGSGGWVHDPKPPAYEPDDGPVDPEVLEQLRARAKEELPQGDLVSRQELFPENPHPPGWMFKPDPPPVPQAAAVEVILLEPDDDDSDEESPELKAAMTQWKAENPTDTLKHQRKLFDSGQIDELPWMKFLPSHEPTSGFGTHLPKTAVKGDSYVLTTTIPNVLYKFNGTGWIKVDNSIKDQYTYDIAYIDHLIVQIEKGLYDPELLSDSESNQIHLRLSEQRIQQLPE